ncbi:MAG TPA: asparagine synthase-related protein [Steroidobacteraceae bacterium]|nr:asparagine synthase-related protein [Steroidobacteraceae bacterium]
MSRYVAFLRETGAHHGDAVIDEFLGTHPGWKQVDAGKGLSLFHLPSRDRACAAIELPAGYGAILGTLFPRDLEISPRNWAPVIDESVAKTIVDTRGRHLMDNYWGGYVAFLNDRAGSRYVLRDSSGKIPCYVVAHGGFTIVCSNILNLSGLALPPFSLNPRYLAGFIYEAELAQRECGVNEIRELLAGECLASGETETIQSLWDPRVISRLEAVDNFTEASREVRRITQACVDFWGSKYDRIILELSGGLDSSVILGCLKRSPFRPHVTCLHIESGGADDNERNFAELAAAEAGVELVVQPGYSQHALYDERVFRLPKAPKPCVANLAITLESDSRNLIPERMRAQSIWDGQGGDHLFFEPRSPFGAVDYAFRHGITGDFLRCVRDAVRRSKLSYWGVLERSMRLGLLRGRWHLEDEYDREAVFLNPEIVPADIADYVWQPWQTDCAGLPPGKRWQICLIACLLHRHRPVPGLQYAAQHHPLFSQPLIELCLRIPLHTLLQGGADRALERAAFRDCVPGPIIRRENKGTVAITVMSKIRECLPFLRELVLDGVLARERIIERSELMPYLAGNRPMSQRVLWPFLACIAAEVWARKWAAAAWRL